MDADLIGLFALLVGLELILGVDNVYVIAILVSLPEKRNITRNFCLTLLTWEYNGHWWSQTRTVD